MKKNILFIIGSLRRTSFNLEVAQHVETMTGGQATVQYLSYADVPMMNQDIEYPAPEAVTRLRHAVSEADGIWIFSPEYNSSYPGHLKNVLDWLSRPSDTEQQHTAIRGKKITLSGAGGQSATAACREKLSELLTKIGADVMPHHQTGIVLNTEAWTEGKLILTAEQLGELEEQTKAFLAYIS